MILVKDGEKINLADQNHIAAFFSNGWVEAKASAPVMEEQKSEPADEFMNAPEAPEAPEAVDEVVEKPAAPAPRRGRKKQEK